MTRISYVIYISVAVSRNKFFGTGIRYGAFQIRSKIEMQHAHVQQQHSNTDHHHQQAVQNGDRLTVALGWLLLLAAYLIFVAVLYANCASYFVPETGHKVWA